MADEVEGARPPALLETPDETPEGTSPPARRAALLIRVISKSIDIILIFAAAEALPRAGWFAGLGYMLIGDGFFEGRSLGKKLTGLRVVSESGSPCSMRESVLRNSTLAVALLLYKIPLLGWVLALAVAALEFVLLLGSKDGRRLGDELAKTYVLETAPAKEPIKGE